ncbi:MAG TPA: IS1595 family transposase [Actinomycetota bacterium]|nr:IS1595 family transposase [Actinomycetota bacterium]
MAIQEDVRDLFPSTVVQAVARAVTPGTDALRVRGPGFAGPVTRFRSEEKCRTYLERLRWPEGVRCPRCGGRGISRIRRRDRFECNDCRYQFSVRVGTPLQGSHLPLWKWMLAFYAMAESGMRVSTRRLCRILDVSYPTARSVRVDVARAMARGGLGSAVAGTDGSRSNAPRAAHGR